MNRKTLLTLGVLILLPLSIAFGQEEGQEGKAISAFDIVGTWDVEMTEESGYTFKILWTIGARGDTFSIAQGFPGQPLDQWGTNTTQGCWKRIGRNLFVQTSYFMLPDYFLSPAGAYGALAGYFKGVQEFWMVNEDTIEGWGNTYLLVGTDPMNPEETYTHRMNTRMYARRLEPERP